MFFAAWNKMLKLEAFENLKGQTFRYVSLDGVCNTETAYTGKNQSKY